nr:hypothetical protein [Tanacetum cinerariifolium]
MGYTRGVGKGHLLSNEIGNEGSYGGTAGHGFYNDTCIEGGLLHSDAELPCQLGSGGGNDSTTNSGVLGTGSNPYDLYNLDSNGSGGTILLFVNTLSIGESTVA